MRSVRLAVLVLLLGCNGAIEPSTAPSDGSPGDEKDGGRASVDASASESRDAADGRRDGASAPQAEGGRPQSTDAAASGGTDAASARDAAAMNRDGGTSPSVDAGAATPDAARDGGGTTSDTVPVFVAVGYGTRRIVSCDNGLSWRNDQADVPNGADDGYLARGLAAGGGAFVMAVGGGGVQKLFSSVDGVEWTRIMRTGNGYSDVAFGNGRFVAGGGHISVVSTDGGRTWGQEGTMGSGGILRHLAFGSFDGGRFVAVGDQGRRMNSRDGVTWGAERQAGQPLIGVDYGANVFVAITSGSATEYSEDGGATWTTGSIPGASEVRGILYDHVKRRFIVTTRGATFTSENGKDWVSHTANGGPASFAVSDDGAHYVGANADVLYHSTDGIGFMPVQTMGQAFTRVKFQRVTPSSVCPK